MIQSIKSTLGQCGCGEGQLYIGNVFLNAGMNDESSSKAMICTHCNIVLDIPKPCQCYDTCYC